MNALLLLCSQSYNNSAAEMMLKNISILFSLLQFIHANYMCEYTKEWTTSFERITPDDRHPSSYHHHRMFTVGGHGHITGQAIVTVSVTATVGGMLPPKAGDILLTTSKVNSKLNDNIRYLTSGLRSTF